MDNRRINVCVCVRACVCVCACVEEEDQGNNEVVNNSALVLWLGE